MTDSSRKPRPWKSGASYEDFLRFCLKWAKQDARDWEERCKRMRGLIPRSRRKWTVGRLKQEQEHRKRSTADARDGRQQNRLREESELTRRVKALRREGYTFASIAERLRDEGKSISRQRVARLARS